MGSPDLSASDSAARYRKPDNPRIITGKTRAGSIAGGSPGGHALAFSYLDSVRIFVRLACAVAATVVLGYCSIIRLIAAAAASRFPAL